DYLDEALRLATVSGDSVLAAHAVGMRGLLACLGGDLRRGVPDLQAGVAAFAALPAPLDLRDAPADVGGGMAPTFRSAGVFQQARTGRLAEAQVAVLDPLADAATAPAWTDLDPAGITLMHEATAAVHAALGRPLAARRAFAQARAGRRAAEHSYQVSLVALHELRAAVLPYQADHLAERRALADEAEAAWDRASTMRPELPLRLIRLPLLLLEGDWDEAHALAQSVLEARRGAYVRQFLVGDLGQLLFAQGKSDLVWRLVRELLPEGPVTAPGGTVFAPALVLQRLAAALALDAGDSSTARAWLAAHDHWLAWSGAVLGQVEGQLGWAAYHRAAGDLTLAHEHAERALTHATEPRQPLALLAAHRLLGELATADGRYAEARSHLDTALALADACAAPYERALCLLALAETELVSGRQSAAGAALADARATLTALQALPALARCDTLAALLPSTTNAPAGSYSAHLTAREVEVLRLVVAGASNREMAATLSRSERTIERHLENIYRKIDARNRADATAYALRRGLA
ncbi:MAG: response regulator transcription factor, partial [Thermomicrobiales bacterium]